MIKTEAKASYLAGAYLINGTLGNVGMPGTPIMHFSLGAAPIANSESAIVGITQPILPNGQILVKNVIGAIRATGYGNVTKVVSLSGQYIVSVPPSGIQFLLENFTAIGY